MIRLLRWRGFLYCAALAIPALAPLLAAAQGSTPLIYQVRSATNTIFLFGTVHVGTRALYPLDAKVEAAFARSRILALEADPNDRSGVVASMQRAMYTPPDHLENHVPPALIEQLKAVLPSVGLPFEYARAMKPHLLAITISMLAVSHLGYDPALGLDLHFAKRAEAEGKPLLQLESMSAQLQILEEIPPQAQEAMLRVAVQQIAAAEVEPELEALLAAWSAGDPDRIKTVLDRETEGMDDTAAEQLKVALYDRRNHAMADKLAVILRGDVPHFVAIGAGHLLGEAGLPQLLRQRGFSVERM